MSEEKSLTVVEKEAQNSLLGLLKKHERELSSVLPQHLGLDRWRWLVVNSIRKSPNIAGCTPFSFLNSVMLASNLGIEIRDRSAYLVPFGRECQLLIDYRAKIDLAARAGVTIHPPQIVRERDEFDYGWKDGKLVFEFKPRMYERVDGLLVPQERGEIVGVWCKADMPGQDTRILVMGLEDIDRIRKRSRNGFPEKSLAELCHANIADIPYKQRGPWLTDPERMVEKTIVHQIFNRVPQTEHMAKSQDIDAAGEAENVPMPVAPELEALAVEIDPADNRPMVEGGEGTREERKAEQKQIAAAKIKKAKGEPAELPDPMTVSENQITLNGVLYEKNADQSAWRKVVA